MESRLFTIGMYWRVSYGVLRTLLGLVLLKLINVPLADLLHMIMGQELIEDPADVLLTFTNNFLQLHPFQVTYFLSAYLIFWGFIDIFISVNLLKQRMWAFPVSLWLIAFFILYLLYRFAHTHSLILLSVILLDVIIFWLIQKEYKKVKLARTIRYK